MLRCRRLASGLILACVALTVSCFLAYRYFTNGLDLPQLMRFGHGSCDTELEQIQRHLSLPAMFQYGRRTIRARPTTDLERKPTIHLEGPLFQGFEVINLNDRSCALPDSGAAVLLDYPEFTHLAKVDTSSLMIGASTTLGRLRNAIPQMARWISSTTTSLVVIVQDSDDWGNLETVQELAESAGIDITLVPNIDRSDEGDRHAQRHFNILKALYKRRGSKHNWFGIIDDDTFFPSLPLLMDALKPYDPTRPWYIGTLSEDWHAIARLFGYMGYGGAGVFLSLPLLETLYANFDSCKTAGMEGDKLYRDCIYTHTSPPVQLTQLKGLHQLDFFGDVSEWYEGGIKPILSLHHYAGWHRLSMQYAHLVVDVCGPECFLQRYQFSDGVVLTNGYSVVEYPGGTHGVDFGRVEGTFLYEPGQFDFSLGALRPKLPPEDKLSWRLEFAMWEDDGRIRQFYIKRKGQVKDDAERLKLKIESVLELEWTR